MFGKAAYFVLGAILFATAIWIFFFSSGLAQTFSRAQTTSAANPALLIGIVSFMVLAGFFIIKAGFFSLKNIFL